MNTAFKVLAVIGLVVGIGMTAPTNAQSPDQFEIAQRAYENKDYKTAWKILMPLAKQGQAEAQVIISDMYNIGRGVQQDNSRAIEWYRKAAELGNLDAIQMLGQGMRLLGESSP